MRLKIVRRAAKAASGPSLSDSLRAIAQLTDHVLDKGGPNFRRGTIVGTSGPFYLVQPNGETAADGHLYPALLPANQSFIADPLMPQQVGTPSISNGSNNTGTGANAQFLGASSLSLDTRGTITIHFGSTAAAGQMAKLTFSAFMGLVPGTFINRNTWVSTTTYNPGDVVFVAGSGGVNGVSYLNIATSLNNTPPNATYWTPLPSPIVTLTPLNSVAQAAGLYVDGTQLSADGFAINAASPTISSIANIHYTATLAANAYTTANPAPSSSGYDVLIQETSPGNPIIHGFLKNS